MEKFINNFGEKLNLTYTGIGSLPFSGENAVYEAVDFVFKYCKDFPFWPQLPHFKIEENMVLQFSKGLLGLKYDKIKHKFLFDNIEDFINNSKNILNDYDNILHSPNLLKCENILDKYKITLPYSNTIDIFLNKIKNLKNKPNFIKGTITGPLTFLTNFDKINPSYFNDIKTIIPKFLTLKALWQIKEFKKASNESIPVIFIDEPALAQMHLLNKIKEEEITLILQTISSNIQKFNALSGIHCCGKTNWTAITDAMPDIINFDAYFYIEDICKYSKHIENFLKNGGFLGFGIIPTHNMEEVLNLDNHKLFEKFQNSIDMLSKNIDRNLILKQSFITPGCGCSSLSIDLAEKTLILARELSATLKIKNEVKI